MTFGGALYTDGYNGSEHLNLPTQDNYYYIPASGYEFKEQETIASAEMPPFVVAESNLDVEDQTITYTFQGAFETNPDENLQKINMIFET